MSSKTAAFVALSVLTAGAGTVSADPVEDFYKGKRITITVGGTPGGGYDVYARQFARFYGNYIPGKPDILVQNLQGAGSIRATNHIYNVAPRDGTAIVAVQRTIPTLPLFNKPGIQYDPLKLNWIGSLNNEVSVCVSRKDSGVATFEEAKQKELIIGGSGANDTENFPSVLNNLLGTKFKIISGYKGPDIALAMERNEVQGRCGWSWTSLSNQHGKWLKDGSINVLVQLSVEKLPEINAPLVMDLTKDKAVLEILNLVFAPQAFGRPFAAPPEVPAERVKALRDGLTATAKDKTLITELEKLEFSMAAVSGERMQQLVTDLMKTSPDVVKKASDAMQHTKSMKQ